MQNSTKKYAVELNGVNFSYNAGEPILTDVNLCLPSGSSMVILGPNGGGKTTLLRLILGLCSPQKGTITVHGGSPKKARDSIGYVPQYSTLNTALPASALDIVLMGAAESSLFYGVRWKTDKESKQTAIQQLERVGLGGLERMQVAKMSGGQRQRVLIARALFGQAVNPKNMPYLLILDEPTANIDPQGKFCFYDFLQEVGEGLSMMVVSHDLSMVNSVFSNFAFINQSVNVFNASEITDDLFSQLFGSHSASCPLRGIRKSGQAEQWNIS